MTAVVMDVTTRFDDFTVDLFGAQTSPANCVAFILLVISKFYLFNILTKMNR